MRGMGRKLSIMLMTVAVLALGSGTALATDWTFTDLSLQGGIVGDSYALGINNNGDIVGKASFAGLDTHDYHATLWSGGVANDLGTLGLESSASSINDSGVIAGKAFVTTFPTDFKAALFSIGADPVNIHPYDIAYSVSSWSGIGDINNSGKMVGSLSTDYYDRLPILWSDSETYTILDAGPLNNGNAHRINNLGQVTGLIAVNKYDSQGNYLGWFPEAAFWDADGTLTPLGTFDGKHCFTGGLNDLGQVPVNVDNGNAYERWTYVWQDGAIGERLADLGGGLTDVHAINSDGLIVGTATTADGEKHAVLWQAGEIIDLNDLVSGTDLILEYASDINEQGQIIGWGVRDDGTATGQTVAFLLSPNLTPTPVPTSVLLFGSGIAGLALIRRRMRA